MAYAAGPPLDQDSVQTRFASVSYFFARSSIAADTTSSVVNFNPSTSPLFFSVGQTISCLSDHFGATSWATRKPGGTAYLNTRLPNGTKSAEPLPPGRTIRTPNPPRG